MAERVPIECPRCKSTDVALLSERTLDDYPLLRFGRLKVLRIYRCKCGVAFTVNPPDEDDNIG